MHRAAHLFRERHDRIARILVREQGKVFAEARIETLMGADIIDWYAEEGRRSYGRIVPGRNPAVRQLVVHEPVGIVAAFTPWNFPVVTPARKIAGALGAGCAIIIKPSEETPGACVELARCFADAGVPAGVINLVYGIPAEISSYLIPHPTIKKISFTGSTAIGKQLAAMAGLHMKRVTMELGGHAPAIVFGDADVDVASKLLATNKYRNAGQVCVSPTRMLVHESVYQRFVTNFVSIAQGLKVGPGDEKGVMMGPLANARRVTAMESLVGDAVQKGATLETGGKRIGNKGNFFEPTVLTNVNNDMRVMNEEPFGPLAVIAPFSSFDDVIAEANRLPYGLAAYAYTASAKTANAVAAAVESGMMSINHHGLALPEVPFGGIKDSGYGSEGGSEAIEAYLNTKFVTQAGL